MSLVFFSTFFFSFIFDLASNCHVIRANFSFTPVFHGTRAENRSSRMSEKNPKSVVTKVCLNAKKSGTSMCGQFQTAHSKIYIAAHIQGRTDNAPNTDIATAIPQIEQRAIH
jgi:hypothetical protein